MRVKKRQRQQAADRQAGGTARKRSVDVVLQGNSAHTDLVVSPDPMTSQHPGEYSRFNAGSRAPGWQSLSELHLQRKVIEEIVLFYLV